jgi:hypothetical protein
MSILIRIQKTPSRTIAGKLRGNFQTLSEGTLRKNGGIPGTTVDVEEEVLDLFCVHICELGGGCLYLVDQEIFKEMAVEMTLLELSENQHGC